MNDWSDWRNGKRKNRRIVRSCGKMRYRDKREALLYAHRRTTSQHEPAAFLRVYECHACNGWHLTSQPVLLSEKLILVEG